MKRVMFFLFASIILIAFCSCELCYQAPEVGTMRILTIGNDYSYGSAVYYFDEDHNEKQLMIGEQPAAAKMLYKTVGDAEQVALALSTLASKAGIAHQTVCLTEKDSVTKSRLVSELEALASITTDTDITIIFYSGHGFGDNKKQPYGYDTSTYSYMALRYDERPNSSILFSVSDFLALVEKIKGVKVVLGDFCYSGALVQSNNFSVTSGEYSQMDAMTLFAEYRDEVRENPSLFCLSASRYNELSYERTPLHGNFTNALLQGLGWDEANQCLTDAGAEKNGRITLFGLAKYITAHDGLSEQTPMVSGGSNDIVLFSF